MKASEQIKLNAKNMLRFYKESKGQWLFPLVSMGSFLFLSLVISLFEFIGLTFLLKPIIQTNQAVFDACSKRIDQKEDFKDTKAQFEKDLQWEQDIVEQNFKLPFYLKPFFFFGLVLNPITQRFYLAIPLWKRSEREKMAINIYNDIKKIGTKSASERAQKFFTPYT